MTQVYNDPITRVFKNDGSVAVGYQKFFYETGTTTKKSIFADANLTTPLTNPILSDANGYFEQVFMEDTGESYKVVLADDTDTDPPTSPIWTADPVEVDANDINSFDTRPAQHWGTTTGSDTAYQISPKTPIASYTDDLLFSLQIHIDNTGAATLEVEDLNDPGNFLPALDIKKYDGTGGKVDVEAADLQGNQTYIFRIDATDAVVLNPQAPYLDGKNLGEATTSQFGVSLLNQTISIANNSTDADHDMDFVAGVMQFNDGSGQAIGSAITKKLDEAWVEGTDAGGLFTGTIAANTWYYCFAIWNPTTETYDAGFDPSLTSPTLPSGYTKYEYRGAIRTDGSSNIRPGLWIKDYFEYTAPITDSTTPLTTSQSTITLTVPPIDVIANFSVYVSETTTGVSTHSVVQPVWKGNIGAINASTTTISTGSDADASGRPVRNNVPLQYLLTNSQVYADCDTDLTETTFRTYGFKDLNIRI